MFFCFFNSFKERLLNNWEHGIIKGSKTPSHVVYRKVWLLIGDVCCVINYRWRRLQCWRTNNTACVCVCVFKDALIKKKANWGRCYGQTKAYLVQQQLPSTEIKVRVISCNTTNRTPPDSCLKQHACIPGIAGADLLCPELSSVPS